MKSNLTDFSTIAAIATPPGNGGVGIIRISGTESLEVLKKLFIPSSMALRANADFESHRMYHGRIVEPLKGETLDEVLAVYMKGPRSFTAEDVVEIHGHGGSFVLGKILSLVIENGARMASPGEFAMRAFLNGRIDLTQAEGILDLIEASSSHALKLAASQISGGIRSIIEAFREKLRTMHAGIEALIDFPDETEDSIELSTFSEELKNDVIPEMDAFLKTYEETRFLREGVKLVIAGPPNAGKSSLMNALTGEERSIVTSVPGTTRDLVREKLSISGTPLLVTDTAGLRDSEDEVESIGIGLTRKALSEADAVLWVLDITREIDDEITEAIKSTPVSHRIIVWNKSDLSNGRPSCKPHEFEGIPCAMISAKTGLGLEELKKMLADQLLLTSSAEKSGVALNLRHKNLLESSLSYASGALEALELQSPEMAAEDLKAASACLESILGENQGADILDEIFSRFCIGK